MPLEFEELKKRLKEPKKRETISKAVAHENRLKFHAKTTLGLYEDPGQVWRFLDWVKSILLQDKYEKFCQLLQFPLETVALNSEIFEALAKIFDGRNPVYKYEFVNERQAEDWSEYKESYLKGETPWRTQGFEAMKYAINSVLIVDMPTEQVQGYPAPYFYWLSIGSVIDFEMEDEEQLSWIIFKQEGHRIAVFDDQSFRVFKLRENSNEIETEEVNNPHDLGYCPARFFWSKPISWETPELKAAPITEQLSALDWYLFFATSKKHLDLYAPYTIYSGLSSDCDFEDEGGNACDGGYMRDIKGQHLYVGEGKLMECPKCSKNRIVGPGSFIEYDPPTPENGNVDLSNPIQSLPVDRPSLDYNVQECDRLKQSIFTAVTGNSIEVIGDQAVNEKQVMSLFESRKAVLVSIKRNFEKAQSWAESTICKLRYGSGFVSLSISYGTEFYLFSEDVILKMYEDAKANNLDFAILDILQNQYYETKYRNNLDQLQRSRILADLDPFRHLSTGGVAELFKAGLVNREDYYLKANFSTLLGLFERENLNVLEFADGQPYSRKISLILEGIKSYIPAAIAPAAVTVPTE